MPTPTYRTWLEHRHLQVPDVGQLAFLIARSGAAGGVSRDDLARALGVPPKTLEVLLRAMVTAGQVRVVKVGGQFVYRATM